MAEDFRCVEDGQELLDYVHRQGKYTDTSLSPWPDLILLDLNMPKKDGWEALKEIKSHPDFRRIPVVILTTSQNERDIAKSYDMGANSFMTKPSDFKDFIELVRTLGEYWFRMVKLPPSSLSE
jgi:CheY-like chemotaxis protein